MEQQFAKQNYSASQTSMLSKTMLIASIAFIILGVSSYGWSVLFLNTLDYNTFAVGLGIFLATLISGMIVSMIWVRNMFKSQSMALTILCYAIYIVTASLAFGWLFSLAAHFIRMFWLPVIFAITGGVFLLSALFSKLLSANGVMTFGKIIGATAIAMGIFLIVFLILTIIFVVRPSQGIGISIDTMWSLIMLGMAAVSFFYIVIDIWSISKTSQFVEQGEQQANLLAWFFGFRLLTDLVNMLFIVLIYVLRFARRG